MNTREIELALARVVDAVELMYDQGSKYSVIPDHVFKTTVGHFENFPNVTVDATPDMPSTWTNADRYAFICRVVTVMRETLAIMDEGSAVHQKHRIVVGLTYVRLREFTQALGTLASASSDAIAHSHHLILATCMHTA